MTYEYKYYIVDSYLDDHCKKLEKFLNEHGQQGFCVVQDLVFPRGEKNIHVILLERET